MFQISLVFTLISIDNVSACGDEYFDEDEQYLYGHDRYRFCTCGGNDCYEDNGIRIVYLGCCNCRFTFGRDDNDEVRHYEEGCPYFVQN